MSYQKTVDRCILLSSPSIVLPRVMNLCHTEDTSCHGFASPSRMHAPTR